MADLTKNNLNELDFLCDLLRAPLGDYNLVTSSLPSWEEGFRDETWPVPRTFVAFSFYADLPTTLVFYLAPNEREIAYKLIQDRKGEWADLVRLMRTDDPELGELSMTGISQLLFPAGNTGSELLKRVTFVVAKFNPLTMMQRDKLQLVSIVFYFSSGIRFGLQVYDRLRLSMCFNEMCDDILAQAQLSGRVEVIDRVLTEAEPLLPVKWFD